MVPLQSFIEEFESLKIKCLTKSQTNYTIRYTTSFTSCKLLHCQQTAKFHAAKFSQKEK